MKLTNNELVTLAACVLMDMRSPHLPMDCPHYLELDALYTKLTKEIDHVSYQETSSINPN